MKQTLLNIKDDPIYSIAMRPLGVVDYLQRACDLRAAGIVQSDSAELILGLCGTKMQMYGGLEHYVYQLNSKVYSWGMEFNNVEYAAKSMRTTWNVGYKIAIVRSAATIGFPKIGQESLVYMRLCCLFETPCA